MPRDFLSLVRKSGFVDAEKFFILGYEGKVTEKKYFEDFRYSSYFNDSGKIEIVSVKRGKKEGNSPIKVKALLSRLKNDYNFRKTDEFWLIIDRDNWEEIHNIDIDQFYEDCQKEKNFHVALSNPCFEMWLILHLSKLSDISEEDQKKIFENCRSSKNKHYIDEFLAKLIGNNRGYNKKPNPKVFLPLIKIAIKNAEEISNPQIPYPKTLGSDVFRLMKLLVK